MFYNKIKSIRFVLLVQLTNYTPIDSKMRQTQLRAILAQCLINGTSAYGHPKCGPT